MSINRTTPPQKATDHDTGTRPVVWLRDRAERRRAERVGLLTADYLNDWIDGRLALRASTAASYRSHLDRYLIPLLGQIPLADLRIDHIQRMHHQLLSEGMTPATLARVHATLSAALNAADRRGLLPTTHPLVGVELPRADAPDLEVWTLRQARTFLVAVRGDPYEGLWRVALTTGMRRGEILGLRWADLDLDRGLLTVRANRVAVGGTVIEGLPKSRSGRRTLHLDPQTTRVLRLQHRATGSPEGYVFTTESGEPLSPWWVSRRFTQIVDQAGLPPIRFHDLRHTSATLGLAHGESLKAVSQRLGHSDITVTANVYTAVPDDVAHRDAVRLADRLDNTDRNAE